MLPPRGCASPPLSLAILTWMPEQSNCRGFYCGGGRGLALRVLRQHVVDPESALLDLVLTRIPFTHQRFRLVTEWLRIYGLTSETFSGTVNTHLSSLICCSNMVRRSDACHRHSRCSLVYSLNKRLTSIWKSFCPGNSCSNSLCSFDRLRYRDVTCWVEPLIIGGF